jgi:hypothetical protein
MFLLYPVVSMESDIAHILSRNLLLGSNPDQGLIDEFSAEKKVTAETPKTFFAHAVDDGGVSPQNSIRFHNALVDSGIASKLVLFGNGGHGTGICKTGVSELSRWPDHCTNWLNSEGLTDVFVEIDTVESPPELNNLIKVSDQIKIFPNPNNGEFNIIVNTEEMNSTGFIIQNSLGQQIYSGELKKEGELYVCKAKINSLKPGIYYLTLTTKQGVLSRPIIVRQ